MEDQRLPKSARLTKRPQYQAIQRLGRKVVTPHFVLRALPGPAAQGRLGITVSRKVAAAVGRNRVKRLVREAFRLGRDRMPDGMDVVVIARQGAPGLDLARVRGELYRAWAQLGRSGQTS